MKQTAIILLVAAVAASGCISDDSDNALSNSASMGEVKLIDKSEINTSESARVDCEEYFEDDPGEHVSDKATCYNQSDGGILIR